MIHTSVEAVSLWRKSRHSQNGANNCVSVTQLPGAFSVRDSKNPNGPTLRFRTASFNSFLEFSRMS